ncbi:MAG TPA: hypothetical protein VFE54_05075 [Mucilaginibacter sp.]|jgi:hypothetical protein|nr:hypothetical protein [Mucilaginibacter sp.]
MKKSFHLFRKTSSTSHILQSIFAAIIIAFLLIPLNTLAQTAKPDTAKTMASPAPVAAKPGYPRAVGYLSFIFNTVTFTKDATTYNFSHHSTSIGFPVGVNVLYSDHFGFSYEFTPTIKSTSTTSKVSNLLFDPGTMFRFEHGFTIITRLAFETEGRYGFTPVFNQVYARTKYVNYFIAGSIPTRFGNGADPSIGINIQIGFTFN